MSWHEQLRADPLPWLLERESPGARYLALRDIFALPGDSAELRAARRKVHQEGPIAAVLAAMDPLGYWVKSGPGYGPKYQSTVWAMILLAQLGACIVDDKRIARACAYLCDHALTSGGHFSAGGTPSDTADCLQGNLCWALLELGYEDLRLEKAFEWMARSITGEGVAPASERGVELRYYAGKCGPNFACGANNKLPCAWGAVKVMMAFGKLPPSQRTPRDRRAIQMGADFLLSGDPAAANYPNGYSDKPSSNWWKFGFPIYYVTDLLQNVEALVRLGYCDDPRLQSAYAFIRNKQDGDGRWPLEYDYAGKTWGDYGAKRQPNKWVTLRALRVLKAAA